MPTGNPWSGSQVECWTPQKHLPNSKTWCGVTVIFFLMSSREINIIFPMNAGWNQGLVSNLAFRISWFISATLGRLPFPRWPRPQNQTWRSKSIHEILTDLTDVCNFFFSSNPSLFLFLQAHLIFGMWEEFAETGQNSHKHEVETWKCRELKPQTSKLGSKRVNHSATGLARCCRNGSPS